MINVDLHITPMLCRGYQWYVVESKRNSSETYYPVFACYAGQQTQSLGGHSALT